MLQLPMQTKLPLVDIQFFISTAAVRIMELVMKKTIWSESIRQEYLSATRLIISKTLFSSLKLLKKNLSGRYEQLKQPE